MKPLTKEQADHIENWLNSWDQIRGTVIPLRFREDIPVEINNPVTLSEAISPGTDPSECKEYLNIK